MVDPSPIMDGMGELEVVWALNQHSSSHRVKCILCKFDTMIMVVTLGIIIFISSLTLIRGVKRVNWTGICVDRF